MNKKTMTIMVCLVGIACASVAALSAVVLTRPRGELTLQGAAVAVAADEVADAAKLVKWKKKHHLQDWRPLWHNFRDQKAPQEVTIHDFVTEATATTPDEMNRRYPPKE